MVFDHSFSLKRQSGYPPFTNSRPRSAHTGTRSSRRSHSRSARFFRMSPTITSARGELWNRVLKTGAGVPCNLTGRPVQGCSTSRGLVAASSRRARQQATGRGAPTSQFASFSAARQGGSQRGWVVRRHRARSDGLAGCGRGRNSRPVGNPFRCTTQTVKIQVGFPNGGLLAAPPTNPE